MIINYEGKIKLQKKIDDLVKEMLEDEDFTYTLSIHETRQNEKLYKLLIEIINIEKLN